MVVGTLAEKRRGASQCLQILKCKCEMKVRDEMINK